MTKHYDKRKVIGKPKCDEKDIKDNLKKRELLEIELNKKGDRVVTVIMQNPSKASSEESDITVDKIIKFFYDYDIEKIKYIKVVNLFSIYESSSKDLHKRVNDAIKNTSTEDFKQILEHNIDKVKTTLNISNYIVLGWGDCPEKFNEILYYGQAIQILNYINKINKNNNYVFEICDNRHKIKHHLTQGGNPVHPINGPILGMVKVIIDEYKGIIEELK